MLIRLTALLTFDAIESQAVVCKGSNIPGKARAIAKLLAPGRKVNR